MPTRAIPDHPVQGFVPWVRENWPQVATEVCVILFVTGLLLIGMARFRQSLAQQEMQTTHILKLSTEVQSARVEAEKTRQEIQRLEMLLMGGH